jgi:hypothetical protein
MRVEWSLAKCVQGNAVGLRALRAFTILTEETAHGQKLAIGDLKRKYYKRGMSPSTTRWDIRALKLPFGWDGQTTHLIDIEGVFLYPRSVYSISEVLRLEDKGSVTIGAVDLVSLQRFKDLMYDAVGYGSNRDVNGGSTISRIGIKKLTGATINTQRARERRLMIEMQINIAELIPAKEVSDPVVHEARMGLLFGARHRPDVASLAFQIRNTYYSKSMPVTQLIGSYAVRDAVSASLQPVLQPEYGVQSYRQTFNFVPALELVRELLAKNVPIDVSVGHFHSALRGERYGRWIRFEPSFAYTDRELQAGLDYAVQLLEEMAGE